MKKSVSLLLAMLLIVSALTACGGGKSAGDSTSAPPAATGDASAVEPFTGETAFDAVEWGAKNFPDAKVIRFANNTTTATYQTNGGATPALCLHLAKELPIRTNGRYRLEIYPDGILASGVDDIIAGLKEGTFEMNSLVAGNWGSYTDAFTEVNIPFLFTSYEQADKVLKAGLLKDMYERAEEDIDGVLFRGTDSLGFRQLTNDSRPITTPADVNGLKIRVMSDPVQVACWEALGASVITLPYAELYASLQQGVIDGEENPAQNLFNDKFYEVQKYLTATNHLFSVSCVVVSENFYNSMSAEDQKIFEELIVEAEAAGFARMVELDEYFMESCEKAGMQITYLTDEQAQAFKDAMSGVYDMAIETIGQERWNKLQEYLAIAG